MNNTTMEQKQAYVSKLLSANQAAELMKSVFYDWIIPPTGNELRVGFGAVKPENCQKTLFFYVIEAASNIVANLHGDTDSEELLVVVMPEHPEKGVLVVDPAPWGRWEMMSEAVRDILPYRGIGKHPYLQASQSHCRRRHEVTTYKDITLVYTKDDGDNRFILREELEE